MRWIRAAAGILGMLFLSVGCYVPLVRLRAPLQPPQPAPPAWEHVERLLRSYEVSVIDMAFPSGLTGEIQVYDTYYIAGERRASWAARFLLAAAAAAVVLAARRVQPWSWIACGAVAALAAWLFVEVRPAAPEGEAWTAYPPLSSGPAPVVIAWWTWANLAAGTALLAVAAPAPETPSHP